MKAKPKILSNLFLFPGTLVESWKAEKQFFDRPKPSANVRDAYNLIPQLI